MSVLKLPRVMSSIYYSWKFQILNSPKKPFGGHLCFAGAVNMAQVHPCDHLAVRQAH